MNGLYDLDGELRNVGSPDIGADEFVAAPTAATGPASAVTDQAATLAATVNSKGSPTSYHFEYGTTAAYGSSTSDTDAGSGMNDVAASAGVGGLAPAITYHYRVVASNAAGAVNGADQTFTTAPAGSGTPSPTAPGGFGGVKLMSTRLTLKRGFVVVKLSCPAGTAGRCTGVTKLSARRKRTGSRAAATVEARPHALLDRRGWPGEAEGARLPPRAAAVRAHAPAPRQGRQPPRMTRRACRRRTPHA